MTAEAEPGTPAGTTPKLNKALSQLQGDLPQIKKTKTAKVKYQDKATGEWKPYEYSYADLGDVVADVGPLLAKHGLAFHCGPTINPADRREMILLWALLHESGEEKAGEWPLGPVSQKPQSLGSAITYGRRYCFTAATNIVLEDDDDGGRAQQEHGNDHQSAGDLWDKAAPARPAARKQDQPETGPGETDDSRPWAERALQQAGTFKTEAEGTALWRETAAKTIAGECTPKQKDHIQNRITARITARRKEAAARIMRPLADDDPWRLKLEELSDGDDDSARAVLSELGQLKAAGTLDKSRADLIGRAVIARFPRSALTETAPAGQPAAGNLEDRPGSVNPGQLKRLHTILSGFGYDDREQKIGIAEELTGRPLTGPREGTSTANLSMTEADRLIARLNEFTDENGERDRDALNAWLARHGQDGGAL